MKQKNTIELNLRHRPGSTHEAHHGKTHGPAAAGHMRRARCNGLTSSHTLRVLSSFGAAGGRTDGSVNATGSRGWAPRK